MRITPPNAKEQFEEMSEQISRYVEYYQSLGLIKHKSLELAVKSVGLDCEVGKFDMQPLDHEKEAGRQCHNISDQVVTTYQKGDRIPSSYECNCQCPHKAQTQLSLLFRHPSPKR